MLLLSSLTALLGLAGLAHAAEGDSFRESLTLHPLPDGKVSVLFEFTTDFSAASASKGHSHHTLTPPALLLPLEQNDVAELTVSFVAGQWDQRRSGEAGPLHYESGGGGGEVRGWLRGNDSEASSAAWTRVTHALGGLFCAGLGPSSDGETVNDFGHLYPPRGVSEGLIHHLLPHPFLHLCTENLTPFLSLLPSKGISGLSSLLAQPSTVFAWGFKTEGIEVVMPTGDAPGRWRGWWEGVVDPVPLKGGARDFSVRSLFNKGLPRPFSEADESVLRLVMPADQPQTEPEADSPARRWIDGKEREVHEWDLLKDDIAGTDISVSWGQGSFDYPLRIDPPTVTVHRTVTSRHASDGVFAVTIVNSGEENRSAVYSEIWPWWVKGWLHEIAVTQDGKARPELIQNIFHSPSTPPTVSSTSLQLALRIPARSALRLAIPFTKLTIKYTEHRPDAERGVEIPSGMLTFLDLEGESNDYTHNTSVAGRSDRARMYTTRLLLDVPTPDFSMPYNVIIMSSTVMAIFFGLMQGTLTRQWGWVDLSEGESPAEKAIPVDMKVVDE